MLFRVLRKKSFRALVELLLESNEVVGPRQVASRPNGKPIHQLLPIDEFDDLDLAYEKTEYSAKTYFLPFRETLSTFHFEEDDWRQDIRYRIQPRAIVGLHACDVNALLKLDKVMLRGSFPSPYYVARRENTFIVGIDHDPGETCFCASVGADIVTHGFDLFLTDLGDRYFVAIDSDRGFRILSSVDVQEVEEKDRQEYRAVRRRISEGFKTRVNVKNLPTVLDLEFESPVWAKWGDKCLSCGSCAMVCPTCYCYGIDEQISMDFERSVKQKQLYSCTLYDFAEVAGPHNFRPTRESRLKYRYYHQHRGFAETYEEPKCVGCNRCGDACLSGINPPEVIADLEMEDSK